MNDITQDHAQAAYDYPAIARAAHENNRELQIAGQEPHPSAPWDDLSPAEQAAAAADIRETITLLESFGWDVTAAAEAEWARWATVKVKGGWRLGPKDPRAKTHPCLTPTYADLPLYQRRKDNERLSLVRSMAGH